MNFNDVRNQKGKWANKCKVIVHDVGDTFESEHSLAQNIEAEDSNGQKNTITYFFENDIAEINPCEVGYQWFNIRYKTSFFQCVPCEPTPKEDAQPANVWERKDLRIAKMSCIKSAVEYSPAGIGSDTIIGIASVFLKWIYEDKDE
jgi:hypothetical protein